MCVSDPVTHPDRLRCRPGRPAPDAPRHHGHRVRVVEEQAVGAEFGHLVAHLDHHRDRAEAPHDAPDSDRVGDRLQEPVVAWDLEVGECGRKPPTWISLIR